MPLRQHRSFFAAVTTAVFCTALCFCSNVSAQIVPRSVGGVSVDANGVVKTLTRVERQDFAKRLRAELAQVPGDLTERDDLRMVSLRGLTEKLAALNASKQPVPDEIRYLAGLQRVQYIFVVPERNDIVIAGPSEGWLASETGAVVGVESGRPVLRLDDLIVALQAHNGAKRSNISCSIDPTPEGRKQLETFLGRQKRFDRGVANGIEKALGQQRVTLEGVATNSHLASVLVASDVRMKSLAMHLENAPIEGMPSFLDLMKKSRAASNSTTPRWWMACDYDSISRSEDGLSWEIKGQGVKVLTENEIVAEDGSVNGTGKASPIASKWAANMTAKFDELAAVEPVFGQLRNVMDLSVVAALLQQQGLLEKVGMDAEALVAAGTQALPEEWQIPKSISSKCSFVKKNRGYVITASGGVAIESWAVASKTEVATSAASRRAEALKSSDDWHWN